MPRMKDKLEQLGRPIRKLPIKSRDEEQEVEVLYQRPTVARDRALRQAMQDEFNAAVEHFNKEENGESQRSKWLKDFALAGKEKTARFIVANDLERIRTDAIKLMGKEPLGPDATEDEKNEWVEEFKPYFEEVRKATEDEFMAMDEAHLQELAVDSQLQSQAQKRSFDMYRKRLILDAIIEKNEDRKDGEPEYIPVFDNTDEIEEFLAPEVLEDLSEMIALEVKRAREAPLKSVSTT